MLAGCQFLATKTDRLFTSLCALRSAESFWYIDVSLKSGKSSMSENIKIVATNREAYHNYFIDETYEAGIMLTGTEVKSLRDGRANLKDAYVLVKDGEAW